MKLRRKAKTTAGHSDLFAAGAGKGHARECQQEMVRQKDRDVGSEPYYPQAGRRLPQLTCPIPRCGGLEKYQFGRTLEA
jgi:hypothetical protein